MAKPWYKSKTLWANFISAILGGIEASGLVSVVPDEYQPLFFAGLAVLNILLRIITTQPVAR